MVQAYSVDLRERVVWAVASGQSCRAVASTFGISAASVVRWSQRHRATGDLSARAGPPKERSLAAHRAWILARLAAMPDLTLRALVRELGERGVITSYGSLWRIVHDANISYKKNAACR